MTPIGLMNGQDESRCYVNSSFQVFFFIICFRTLIMNIDCGKIIPNLDARTDDYNGYIQKNILLKVIQQNFCEMLIVGRNLLSVMGFFQ